MDNTMKYKVLGQGFDYDATPKREVIAVVDLVPMDDDRQLLEQLPYVLDVDLSSVYAIIPLERKKWITH